MNNQKAAFSSIASFLVASLLCGPAHASQPTLSPYALPWQLRPILAATLVRFDSAASFYSDATGNTGGFASASSLLGSYSVTPDLALIARGAWVMNGPTTGGVMGASVANPLLAGLYSLQILPELRAGFFLGATLPIATGGGDSPNTFSAAANAAAIHTRSAMDNALFSANYFTLIPGVGIAYLAHGLTIQLEATLLQLTRVRGENVDRDPARTNFTTGLELGYAVAPFLVIQGELRMQYWIDHRTVYAAAAPQSTNLSFAVGPRFTFKTEGATFRPGLAYAQGLVGPVARDHILFFDLPILF